MTRGPIRIVCLSLAIAASALVACGGDDDRETAGWVDLPTDPSNPNFDEPNVPPNAQLCSDLQAGREFLAFRIFAEGVSCDEAERVVKSVVEDSPPSGWSCTEVQGTFVQCQNGDALIGFNSS